MKEKFENIVHELLPEENYVTCITHPETGEKIKIISIEEIKSFFVEDVYQGGRRISRAKLADALFERHKNDVVLTPEQVQQNDFHPKSLFYYPRSTEGATDTVDIADSEFHLPLWELSARGVMSGREDVYPAYDGEGVPAYEARVAIKLFHPQYGDGRRSSKDGLLYVKNKNYNPQDPDSLKRLPMSDAILRQYGLAQILKTGSNKQSRSIHEGMKEELPHLLENKALQLNDFRELTLSHEGSFKENFNPKEIPTNGFITLNGVRQYVGKHFAGGYVKALHDSKSLVTDINGNIQAIFNVISKEESIVDTNHHGKVIPRTNASMTQVQSIDYAKLIPDESQGFRKNTVEQKREALMQEVTQAVENLVALADNAEKLVQSEYDVNFSENTPSPENVRAELLAQVERLVVFASKVESEEQLREGLRLFEADVRIFSALSKHAGLPELLAKQLEQIPATELSVEDRHDLRILLHSNYLVEYPDNKDAKFKEGVEKSLEDALQNPDTTFYILRDEGQIVSFYRYDNLMDASKEKVAYFGSFNGNALYKGASGNIPEKTTQEKLTQVDRMFAHCDPQSEVSKKYIESGYIGVQKQEVWGKPSLEIWRSADSDDMLQTKKMSIEELVVLSQQTQSKESDYFVRDVSKNDAFEELDEGLPYLLTRYFTHEGNTYAAFEFNIELSNKFTYAPLEEQKQVA